MRPQSPTALPKTSAFAPLREGKTESTQSIRGFPYRRYAELLGLKGIFVDDPERLGGAWTRSLAPTGP